MSTQTVDHKALDRVLNELDVRAKETPQTDEDSYWVCQRRFPRYPFRANCTVRFLPAGSFSVTKLVGRTRNLSRTGLGFLIRRVFNSGDPVEVEVLFTDRPRVFMAGLARFCRYAGNGFYEVGMELKTAGPDPVFSHNPTQAMHTLDWLGESCS